MITICIVSMCPKHQDDTAACLEHLCQWTIRYSCGQPAVAIVGHTDPQIDTATPWCRYHLKLLRDETTKVKQWL